MAEDGRAFSDKDFKSVQSMPTGMTIQSGRALSDRDIGKTGRALSDKDIKALEKQTPKSKKKKLPKGQRRI
jgi:hypothetical protein